MKKVNMRKVASDIQKLIRKRSPEILTGIGIAGMFTAGIMAVKATPKAMQLIDEEKLRIGSEMYIQDDSHEPEPVGKLSAVEVTKATWKVYAPAVVTSIVSAGCLIGALSVNTRRVAAITTAYHLSETAFSEYKAKTIETLGEKKEKNMREKMCQDKVDNNPVSKTEVIVTGNGKSLFMDPLSNRYFESDIQTIKKIINDLNWNMGFGGEMYTSLSQLYDEIGLSHTAFSDMVGWNVSNGQIEVVFTPSKTDDGERPCFVMDFTRVPEYEFDRYGR